MKNNFLRAFFALILGLAVSSEVYGQISARCVDGKNPLTGEDCANAVTSAVPFLRITPDARGGGMGDVGLATSTDANSMHYNPSKLAFAENRYAISATYTPWLRSLGLNDVYIAYISGYYKIDELQALGLSLRYFSLGDIEFTNDQGDAIGQGRPNEFEVSAAYARRLSDKFSASIGAKFIYSDLASGQSVPNGNQGPIEIKPGIAGAADLSLNYRTPIELNNTETDLSVGLAITNLGSKITYTNSINRDYIPANIGLGLAWRFRLDDYNDITITSDFNKLLVPTPCVGSEADCNQDGDDIADYRQYSPIRAAFRSFGDAPGGFSEELNEITIGTGVEYWYDDQFALRAGYFYEHYSKGNRKYFSVGLGVKYNIFGINFSYLVPTTNQRNPLDNTLRFSLSLDFNDEETE